MKYEGSFFPVYLLSRFVGDFSSPHDLEQDESNALAILDDYFTGAPCHANKVYIYIYIFKKKSCIHTRSRTSFEAESAERTSKIARIAACSRGSKRFLV